MKEKRKNNKKKTEPNVWQQTAQARKIAVEYVLPALILLFTLGIIGYYIFFPAEGYLHSDCTDTILWALASFESGELITADFDYAALLPFAGNLLMLIYMPFFGYSMTTHNLGMLTFALLLFFAAIYFCRGLKMKNLPTSLFVFTLFFVLSSSDKLREIMWGHVIYYSLGVLFFLLGFGIMFRLCDRQERAAGALDSKKSVGCFIYTALGQRSGIIFNCVLFFFCALTATNGTQSLLTFLLPLLGAIFLVIITDTKREGFWSRTIVSGTSLAFVALGTLAGLVLGSAIKGDVASGYASAYSTYSNLSDWVDNLLLFPIHFYELLDVKVKLYDPIVSLDSVFTMIKVFGGLLILFLPFVMLFYAHKTNDKKRKILVYAHFLLCTLLMYAYVCGLLATANWRLVPLIASSLIVSLVTVFDLIKDTTAPALRRLGALMLALILMLAAIPCAQIAKMPSDYGRDNELHRITDRLLELDREGILPETGYASFWNCQAVTLLSDNEIKLRNVSFERDIEQNVTVPTKAIYQQYLPWYTDESLFDGCYLVVSNYEKGQLSLWLLMYDGKDYVYSEEYEGYTIYVYEENILD